MRLRSVLMASVFAVLCVATLATPTFATSLRIAPLKYETSLKPGEKQKGYVDISNPGATTVDAVFEAQAFRQANDEGGIEFYEDKDIASGISLDLTSAELGPREVLRLMFVIDGSKLPQGDVYAAILAHTVPRDTRGSAQSVRVGTILEVKNGAPQAHKASISDLGAPFLQIGEGISTTFVVRSDDATTRVTGFHPSIRISIAPYLKRDVEGPLVFAGHSRTVTYKEKGNYFGFVWVQVSIYSSSKGQLVFAATGYWRWLGPLMIVSGGSLVAMLWYTHRRKH